MKRWGKILLGMLLCAAMMAGVLPGVMTAAKAAGGHSHNFTYALGSQANTVIATCTAGCPDGYDTKGVELVLCAPEDLVWDGQEKDAYIDVDPYPAPDEVVAVLDSSDFVYYASTGEGSTTAIGSALSGSPADAGNYVAKVTWGGVTATVAFTIVEPTGSITFSGRVTLTGRTLTGNDVFRFEVREGETVVATGTNDANGDITFTGIKYGVGDADKLHTYTVTEAETDRPGVTIDSEARTVEVEVINEGKAALRITPSDNFTGLYFANSYTKPTASVSTVPEAKELTYNGTAQALVTPGVAVGGTMMYAIGEDNWTAPGTGWSESIPEKTDAGDWYVWFKAKGNDDYNDSAPKCIETGIAREEVIITAKGASKLYDGTALTQGSFTPSPLEAGDAHTFTVAMTAASTITDAGTQANEIAKVDGVAVSTGNATVVGNYLVTTKAGKLEVTRREVTLTSKSGEKAYDGTPLTMPDVIVGGDGFVDGEAIFYATGSVTNVADGEVVNKIVLGRGETFKEGNYTITTTEGTLKITPKPLTITAGSDTKPYDGTPLTKNTWTNTDLAAGDTLQAVTITGTQTAAGTSDNVPSGGKIVNAAGTDVTANYAITYEKGSLAVTKKAVTVKAADQKILEGESIETGTGKVTMTGAAEGQTLSAVTLTANDAQTQITASGVKILDAAGNDVTANYDVACEPGKLTVIRKVSHTVTFQVKGGKWDDDKTNNDRVVTLNGYEDEDLFIEADDVPGVGSTPDEGYKAGAWDTVPPLDQAVTGDVTFTYSYAAKQRASHTVTFKVVNGKWDDDKTNNDRVVTLTGYEEDGLFIDVDNVPDVGQSPDEGYEEGAWDTEPPLDQAVTGDVTYTYSYEARKLASHTVTFRVRNGKWDDDKTNNDRVLTLTGYEDDRLFLSVDDVPDVGESPDEGYKEGAWDTAPPLDQAVTGDVTYTYSYAGKKQVSYTVTFKVINGKWNDGTNNDRVVTLSGYEGDELFIKKNDVPKAGESPDQGYIEGGWVRSPSLKKPITKDMTYTYRYLKINTYTVTFRGNGAEGKMDPVEVVKDSEFTLPENGFTTPKHGKFAGWKIDGDIFEPGKKITVSEDITVYVEWEVIKPAQGLILPAIMIPKGDTAFTVSWDAMNDAEGYDVFLIPCWGETKFKLYKSIENPKILRCKIEGMDKGKVCATYVRGWIMFLGKKVYLGEKRKISYAIAGASAGKETTPKTIKLDKTKLTMEKGGQEQLTAKTTGWDPDKDILVRNRVETRWYSSNESVAKVDSNGLVTAVNPGSCTIWAVAINGIRANAAVTVTNEQVYTVTVTLVGKGTAEADILSGTKGTKVKLTATPAEGYIFYNWNVTSGGVKVKDNSFTIGNEDVQVRAVFKKKIKLDDGMDWGIEPEYVYTGKTIRPEMTLRFKGKQLTEGTDYTATWKNNKNIGTATVTVKGTGKYTGTVKKTFQIIPAGTKLTSVKFKPASVVMIEWETDKQADGYVIQYRWKDRKFSAEGTNKVNVGKVGTFTIDKLLGDNCYVRIRSYKVVDGKKYYSKWSEVKRGMLK